MAEDCQKARKRGGAYVSNGYHGYVRTGEPESLA